jgi:hypothetical protein
MLALTLALDGGQTRGGQVALVLCGVVLLGAVADLYNKGVSFVVSHEGIRMSRWGKVAFEVSWDDYAGWRWLKVREDRSGDDQAFGIGVRDAPRAILVERRSGAPPLEVRFGYCGLAGSVRQDFVLPSRRYCEFLDVLRELEPLLGPGWSETAGYVEVNEADAPSLDGDELS